MSKSNDRFRLLYFLFFSLTGSLFLGESGCDHRSKGFALPEGSIENGKINFVGLNCNSCHSIADIAWEGVENQDVHVGLGGHVTEIKTYGELVTSIINPSHKIARNFDRAEGDENSSPMSNYNEVMTVQELVDLVSFLKSEYHLVAPETFYFDW